MVVPFSLAAPSYAPPDCAENANSLLFVNNSCLKTHLSRDSFGNLDLAEALVGLQILPTYTCLHLGPFPLSYFRR